MLGVWTLRRTEMGAFAWWLTGGGVLITGFLLAGPMGEVFNDLADDAPSTGLSGVLQMVGFAMILLTGLVGGFAFLRARSR